MKIKDLINQLQEFDQEKEVMILSGFNGGGSPRDINLGPTNRKISLNDCDETADCEDRVGEVVVVLGFGSY